MRDCRIEFWGDARGQADVLEPLADGVRVLALMETYLHEQYGPCLTVYENELGGRVVAMGYAPWLLIHSGAKRTQLLNLADWITRDRLPVRLPETTRLVPFIRLSPDRTRGAIVLLNAGFDPIEEATVEVRAPAEVDVSRVTANGEQRVEVTPSATGFRIRVEDVAPWTTEVLLLGK